MGKDKWEIENIVLNPIAGATLTQPQTIISPGGHCWGIQIFSSKKERENKVGN